MRIDEVEDEHEQTCNEESEEERKEVKRTDRAEYDESPR